MSRKAKSESDATIEQHIAAVIKRLEAFAVDLSNNELSSVPSGARSTIVNTALALFLLVKRARLRRRIDG